DFGCKAEGYCSDCTRTFLFGDDKKHEEFKKIYAHVLKAHELVLERTVAGMTGRDADEIARGYLKTQGLDGYFTHSLGHGIGLQIHEYPMLSPRGREVLKDGMVFSDEPGVYIAGKLGIRIEDSVFMQNGKATSFMKKTDKNLIVI
ncbi:MAG: M24 family metallopeptidase, partial [Clostridia bacterium]|nr:M24 family metallopeptidase [Clostridia bacterium]